MRLNFFGGGAFAAQVLARVAAVHEVALVVTPAAAASGRKMKPRLPPAAEEAQALRLPLHHAATPELLRQSGAKSTVVCDYGRLLPPEILRAAGWAVNIHPSLLPRWRGAAPIERAVLAGDAATGVSIMQMSEGLDCGDVLAQWRMQMTPETGAAELRTTLMQEGAALLLRVLDDPQAHPPRPQDEAQATYARKIAAGDLQLNFGESAVQCRRRVLAFAPRPGAHFFIGGERLRALAAAVVDCAADEMDGAPQPGTLLAADGARGVVVACGEGALSITHLQRAGRRALPAAEFLRGMPLAAVVKKTLDF